MLWPVRALRSSTALLYHRRLCACIPQQPFASAAQPELLAIQQPLLDTVHLALEHHIDLDVGELMVVSVSGGADSVALLRLLLDLQPRWRLCLHVLHFNHALRPEAGGCYDAQFVLSETNANINLWLRSDAVSCAPGGSATLGCANTTDASSGAVAYYERQGTYETDPWGDELGTIGAMIYTKRVGPISDACVGDEDAEGWTCLGDGLDVTGTYKTTEPSGPGEPTSCASGGSFCQTVGPFALGDGHLLLGLHGPEAYDILELPRHEGSGAATILTFEATSPADLDAKLETAKLAGAKVVKTPYDTAYGHYQVVLGDPDGHIFRLSVAR